MLSSFHKQEKHIAANLLAGDVPGNFKEKFNNFLPAVDYNVIWLDEDYAMEYDCRSVVVTQVDEYCVHFMSRTKTIDDEKLQEMIQFAGNKEMSLFSFAFIITYLYTYCVSLV